MPYRLKGLDSGILKRFTSGSTKKNAEPAFQNINPIKTHTPSKIIDSNVNHFNPFYKEPVSESDNNVSIKSSDTGLGGSTIKPSTDNNISINKNTKSIFNTGDSMFDKYASETAKLESSNNPAAVNRFNYLGLFQLGASALADAGIVKQGTKNKDLDNPNVWNNGLSKDKFLSDPKIQVDAFKKYTDVNKRYLGNKYLNAKTDGERYGLLAASHLIGAGGVKKNIYSTDANGVGGYDRYNHFRNLFSK